MGLPTAFQILSAVGMDWTAIGGAVTLAGIVFWSGSFYGRSQKSDKETQDRLCDLENRVDKGFNRLEHAIADIRVNFARWEGTVESFRGSNPETPFRGRGKGES